MATAATDFSGLFGSSLPPELLKRQMLEQEAIQQAKFSPSERLAYMGAKAGAQLGEGIAGMFGVDVTDPRVKKETQLRQLAQGIDPNSVEGLTEYANRLARAGFNAEAYQISDKIRAARKTESEITKNLRPEKVTGDERYISILTQAEKLAREGKQVSPDLLSAANMAAQMLVKPRSYFDAASGQTVTIPGTDPSKAYPNIFKQFKVSSTDEQGQTGPEVPEAPTVGKPSATEVTAGNLPSTSQARLGTIESGLKRLESSGPELEEFSNLIKSGKVKYDATSNVFDFLGAVVPPAFGAAEKGNQATKDKIERALGERVNNLLLMAKGTQTEGDAQRAKDLIAGAMTRYSNERMLSALESLKTAEEKLKKELGVEKETLLKKGRIEGTPKKEVSKQKQGVKNYTEEQMINMTMNANPGKTREEVIQFLKSSQLLK